MSKEMYYVYSRQFCKPIVIHNSRESALNEAKRLAKKTLQPFEVLQIVSTVKPIVDFEVEVYE